MKKICILLTGLVSSLAFSTQVGWEFSYDKSGDAIPFDKVVIGAVRDGASTGVSGPWQHADGSLSDSTVPGEGDLYIGYSGKLLTLKELSYAPDDTQASRGYATGISDLNLLGLENSLFYFEAYSGERVVSYSELSSYEDLRKAFFLDENGSVNFSIVPWAPTAHAIPEPSSGLLLLIGGALVGLRRKRRAA